MGRYDNKVSKNNALSDMGEAKAICGCALTLCKGGCTFGCKTTSTKSISPPRISEPR